MSVSQFGSLVHLFPYLASSFITFGGSRQSQDLIKKIGVERRVHTAGESKSILDPFLEEKKEDVEKLKSLQKDFHEICNVF